MIQHITAKLRMGCQESECGVASVAQSPSFPSLSSLISSLPPYITLHESRLVYANLQYKKVQ